MKAILLITFFGFLGIVWAEAINSMAQQYLALDSDTNAEGGVREIRDPWFGRRRFHRGWGGFGRWGHGGWGHRGWGYGYHGWGGYGPGYGFYG